MEPKSILLLALLFCHFLGDFTHLSTAWMLNAKRLGRPLFPIFAHALVHSFLMATALEIYCYTTIEGYDAFNIQWTIVDLLFILQLLTHFLIDVWKGRMNGWFPSLQNPANKWHWVMFGFDQFLHMTVIVVMVEIIY